MRSIISEELYFGMLLLHFQIRVQDLSSVTLQGYVNRSSHSSGFHDEMHLFGVEDHLELLPGTHT
jgi:hypothetical protein